MIASLVQFARGTQRGVAGFDADGQARVIAGVATTLDLVHAALAKGASLAEAATRRAGEAVDLAALDLLVPIDTSEPTATLVSGTGLTHLGSADGRDKMHKAAAAEQATDSMRMFLMGLEGGKPAPGKAGVQPEWFYKGDGSILVASGATLEMPAFAEDGGEEPEIAGIYWIDAEGTPCQLGYALGNEFSDHVVERQNYTPAV